MPAKVDASVARASHFADRCLPHCVSQCGLVRMRC